MYAIEDDVLNMIENQKQFLSINKDEILIRDNNRCVFCGNGINEGKLIDVFYFNLHQSSNKPFKENYITLCNEHTHIVHNYKYSETTNKFYSDLLKISIENKQLEYVQFCTEILDVFERNNINGHIEWKK